MFKHRTAPRAVNADGFLWRCGSGVGWGLAEPESAGGKHPSSWRERERVTTNLPANLLPEYLLQCWDSLHCSSVVS